MANPARLDSPMRAVLYELALQSPDPLQLAGFYSAGLGYEFRRDECGLLGTAHARRLRILPGDLGRLDYAAYAVEGQEDLEALYARLERARIRAERHDLPGFLPGALRFADPDGNRFVFGRAEPAPGAQATIDEPRPARLQHVVFASKAIEPLLQFYLETLGFLLSDRVVDENGGLRTGFVRCSKEHHSLAAFAAAHNRLDHHCYEAGDWNLIRDWADHFAGLDVRLKWGPGRHGPGNNLFLFVLDPDGNWVEISAELEHVDTDRPAGTWPHTERTLNSWGVGLLRS